MKSVKDFLEAIKKKENRQVLIVIACMILLAILAAVMVPSWVWLCVVVVIYLICENYKPFDAGGQVACYEMHGEGQQNHKRGPYLFVAEKLYLALETVAKDMGIKCKEVEDMYVPENQRDILEGQDCFYCYSCQIEGKNNRRTLRQLRNYLNTELRAMRSPTEQLVQVRKISQQGRKITFVATMMQQGVDYERFLQIIEQDDNNGA